MNETTTNTIEALQMNYDPYDTASAMRTIIHIGREWVVRCADVKFVMLRQGNGELYSTEGLGGAPGTFASQFALAQKFWQTTARWRELHHRVHELAGLTRLVTNPFMADLNARWDLDYWLVLSRKDTLEQIDQPDGSIFLIPRSAFVCFLSKSGDGTWLVMDIMTGSSISGAPSTRRHALNRAAHWLKKRAESETRLMLELYYARFREECHALNVEETP